jgi:hypothetical protein
MNAASEKQSPDQLAAHDLLSELRIRIAPRRGADPVWRDGAAACQSGACLDQERR